MIRNYFVNVFRRLSRHRNYTVINIAGLTAGIAVCLLIFVIIRFETSFDVFHAKSDRLYRVLTEYHHTDGPVFYGAAAPRPLPSVIKTAFPDLKESSGIYTSVNDQVIILDDSGKTEKKFRKTKAFLQSNPIYSTCLIFHS